MSLKFRRRRPAVVFVTVLVLAAIAGGFAFGAIPDSETGAISACYAKASKFVRVIDAQSSETCRSDEQPLTWNQQGPQGPKGDKGDVGETVVGYRTLRATPDEVTVTAVGSGPLGFPDDANPPTTIVTLDLPGGVYFLDASVAVRKDDGAGDFLCWVTDGSFIRIFTRTSLGTAPGHVRRATVGGSGFTSMPAGGGQLTLACWEAPNPTVPGSPSGGELPNVFYAALHATTVTSATLIRQPAGTVTNLP